MEQATRILLLASFLLLLLSIETLGSFPENSKPISVISLEDASTSSFTGGDEDSDKLRFLQDMKVMKIAGKEYLAITSMNNLYIVNRDDFVPSVGGRVTYTQIYNWKSDEEAKDLCVMKGQTDENCDNYLRVLESMDENGNRLLLCATNSYSPLCQYINAKNGTSGVTLTAEDDSFSGAEKCAFGPGQTGASLYTDGALYSSTVTEFSGRSYTITRNLGSIKQLRTPRFDPKFLNEPKFVKMTNDGERVLIFMNEMVQSENGDVRMVAYVAQVCKNDIGGQHVLVRQWTKFVKTRLNCSRNGFYFDQLQDISDPVEVRVGPGLNDTESVVFATFTTPEYSVPGSAVCKFSLNSIHAALNGRFREERSNGGSDSAAPTGDRHPGSCPSEKYSESELQFLKTHPLLEDQARGALLSTYVGERWSAIAVDPAAGPHQNWTVYFVGTSDGHLVRYLAPTPDLKSGALLSRQKIFNPNECSGDKTSDDEEHVLRIIVDSQRDSVTIAFKHCVKTVPLRSCSVYKCEESCMASADPYCGWDGEGCISYTTPSVNVVQYVFQNALRPKTEIEKLCPTLNVLPPIVIVDNSKDSVSTTTEKEEGDTIDGPGTTGTEEGSKNENKETPVVGDKICGAEGRAERQKSRQLIEDGYIYWTLALGVLLCVAFIFFLIGFCTSKHCCKRTSQNDKEKQALDGVAESRASMTMPQTLCKKAQSFIASISPKRKRKQNINNSSNISNSTLDKYGPEETGTPLIKNSSKIDQSFDVPDGKLNGSIVNSTIQRNLQPQSRSSRLGSTSSQVMINGNGVNFVKSRRASAAPMTASVTSMPSKPNPNYATAPRPRHPSGNRSSDPMSSRPMMHPDDYPNAPTLRVGKKNGGNKSSRHSSPAPYVVPPSPCRTENSFCFSTVSSRAEDEANNILKCTESALRGVEEVIALQQRRSQEMEPLAEEIDDDRPRHDSSDSGNGSSPRDSMQNEEERGNTVSTLPRPGSLELGKRPRRQRLNSEPTSPTHYHNAPLPPPSSHKPVSRSNSMRSGPMQPQLMMQPRNNKRSGSFSFNSQPSTPVGQGGSPPRLVIYQQNMQQTPPQQQHGNYSTLPTKPNGQGGRRGHTDQYARQQPFEYYQVPFQSYDSSDIPNGQAPIMMPDKYSSLPLRSQAHRSKKNQMPMQPQFTLQPPPHHRHSNGSTSQPTHPPPFKKQWSSPAGMVDMQRPSSKQGPRYFPTPTVPTASSFPCTVPEVNEV